VAAPDSNIGFRPIRRPDDADLKLVQHFAHEVRGLLIAKLPYRSEKSQELKPRTLELSDGAFGALAAFGNNVEVAQQPFGAYSGLTGPASKFLENATRIAGVLAYHDDQSATEISKDQARRAVELMGFYAAEMCRLVETQEQSPILAKAQKVLDWLHRGWDQSSIRFQDFCQRGPLRSADDNRTVIPVLEQHGWLKRTAGNGYAGASDVWQVVERPAAVTGRKAV
jgi:hypothetical protein